MLDDPTTLPSQNPDGLLGIVASIREQYHDPKSIEFAGRPDRVAASEQQIAALLLRAGVTEPVVTPATIAQAAYEQEWSAGEREPGFAKLVADRTLALASKGAQAIAEQETALRQQIGPAAHDALIEAAKEGLAFGETLLPAQRADLTVLKLMASEGKYRAAKAAAKPKF